MAKSIVTALLALSFLVCPRSFAPPLQAPSTGPEPVPAVVDLAVGESDTVRLYDGSTARVRLISHDAVRDSVRQAVRSARIRAEVNGREATISCANYRLPVTIGDVQVDCTVTRAYLENSRTDPWGLEKDARLRLWPAKAPLLAEGTYVYPVKQRWFATDTQMANQPSFVDGSESPSRKRVYYHYGLDVGGAEGLTEVVSATDGLIVVRGKEALPNYKDSPYVEVNYDGVVVLDHRGWFHWYFHLFEIDEGVRLGERIRIGQNIGLIGKEGHAGCWSHLHYEIRSPQPSGKPGIQEGYAFLWEAYRIQFSPGVVAVTRPHSLVWTGEPATLDGSLSWSSAGKIARYEWTFTDGAKSNRAKLQRTYSRPGTYSEILKVTDSRGGVAYDFAVVQVVERQEPGARPERLPPTIHAAFSPTLDVRSGQPVSFLVRTCRTTFGEEKWDFGDGSAPVTVKSDGCESPRSMEGYARTQHTFNSPGDYLVRVERSNERQEKAIAHLHVRIEK